MDPAQELPINGSAMPIRTPLFEGRLEVHLKGLPSSQPRMFDGKKRFFHVMCQVCVCNRNTQAVVNLAQMPC